MNIMLFGNIFVSALAKSCTAPQKQKALSRDEKAITIIKSKAEKQSWGGVNGDEEGITTENREKKRTPDNSAVVSWKKLKCRWLRILLSSPTCFSILEAPSLISFFRLLFTFLRHFFLSIPLFYLPPQFPFMVYLTCTPSCAPPFYQPHSVLPVLVYLSDPNCIWQWILSLAMSCLPPGEAAVLGQR